MDYRVRIFRECIKNNEEPLIIYGTGVIASLIIPEIDDYNIEGILDRDIKRGKYCGIPILPNFEEVKKSQRIIILAATSNIPIIYERIEKVCRNRSIKVYDMWGRDLQEVFLGANCDIPYFRINKSDLKKRVLEYDVISFDLYDTLIMRKTCRPSDVFLLMEYQAKKSGLSTSFELRRRKKAQSECEKHTNNPTIYEIYDTYQSMYRITSQEKEALIELEKEIEENVICARDDMKELFNVLTKKKVVVVTSNMYIPSDVLKNILVRLGFSDKFQMFISCEERVSKEEGLFEILKKRFVGKRILHVGDSQVSDIYFSKQFGIDSFYIMSAFDLLVNSRWKRIYSDEKNLIERLLLGDMLKKVFNSPFSMFKSEGRPCIDNLEVFCDTFIVPLVIIYCIFIIREASINGCDYILYGARDGYIFEKIINELRNKVDNAIPKGEYFFASRRATSLLTVNNKMDALKIVSHYFEGDMKDRFFVRLGIRIDEEDIDSDIACIVDKYWDQIKKNTEEHKKKYKDYIINMIGTDHKRIAYVEQSGAGTIISSLNNAYDLSLIGLFIHKTPMENEEYDFVSLFPYKGNAKSENAWGTVNYLFEFFLSSPDPTFCTFKDNTEPMFEDEYRSTSQKEIFNKMQRYVKERSMDFLQRYPFFIKENSGWEYLASIFELLNSNYSKIYVPELESILVDDCYGGESVVKSRLAWNKKVEREKEDNF